MNFMDSVSTCFSKYATFSGRAARPEYWWFALFQVIINIIAQGADRMMGSSVGFIGGIVSLALVLPSLAVATRRLHDTGRSGWWQLLAFTIIGVFVLIYWFASQGENGSNRFGPRPAA